MNVAGTIAAVRAATDAARVSGERVGFVPTMGALHEGHRSLVRRARAETGFVVVSIFVNPTQFGPHEDLDAYPRTLDADLDACREEGADLLFAPAVSEIYPDELRTSVSVRELTGSMEGAARPGHFDGVTLVCAKLFSIVGPCRAFFGEKDAQQLRVVRRMARDLDLPVEVVGCPIVRDADGLALSSRNVYLSADERARALALPRALRWVGELVAGGERDAAALVREALAVLADGPDSVDYVAVVDPDTLQPLDRLEGPALVCAAVRVGPTRLIDNVCVQPVLERAPETREPSVGFLDGGRA